jgi:hypothetical protein
MLCAGTSCVTAPATDWGLLGGCPPRGMGGAGFYSGSMEPARPLRDVFADLVTDEDVRRAHAADPEGFLQAHGHTELPGQLVSEAIVNYADTAPAEIAEHLAPFVMAHSPVPVDGPVDDGTDGLQLLATVPVESYLDELPDDLPDGTELAGPDQAGSGQVTELAGADGGSPDPFDLDFGHGDPVDGAHHVPGAVGELSGSDSAPGHLHETQLDDAFTDLSTGPAGVGELEPGAEQAAAHGWLDDGHTADGHTVDGGHHLIGGGDAGDPPEEDIADL